MDLSNLNVQRIIAHRVFARDRDRKVVPPVLSKSLTKLNTEGLERFQERVIAACGSDSRSATMSISDTAPGSAIDKVISIVSGSEAEFVSGSRELAVKLSDAQTSRKIPGGILVAFSGTTGRENLPCFGLIKAEPHGGFGPKAAEKDSLNLQYINDLILTPDQRMYKIGLFTQTKKKKESLTATDFEVIVYDERLLKGSEPIGVVYFYGSFLGCSIADTASVLTKQFYDGTKEFIWAHDGFTPQEKNEQISALSTYLTVDKALTVSTSDYGKRYFESDVQDDYRNHMEGRKFPTRAVPKDLAYIKGSMRRRYLKFDSGVTVSGPAEDFDAIVVVSAANQKTTTLKISGKIRDHK